jgi:hypothetical protein
VLSPDDGLVPDQFPNLNRRFYDRCPAEHFGHRLRLLLTLWGKPDDLLQLFEDGVAINELAAGGRVELEANSVERFVMADAEVLWHHAAESLMRSYLAHRDLPDCPWLEVARLRSHHVFKRRVRDEILEAASDELRPGLARVLTGTDDPSRRVSAYGESLDPQLEATEHLMRRIADRYLDHSNAYNAAKHGLAVVAGEHGFSLGDPTNPLIKEDGPAISYLEVREDPEGRRRWHNTITWLRLEQMIGSIFWMNRLLETIWSVARGRYVEPEPFCISLPTHEIVDAIDMRGKKAISMPHFPMPLQYWATDDESV